MVAKKALVQPISAWPNIRDWNLPPNRRVSFCFHQFTEKDYDAPSRVIYTVALRCNSQKQIQIHKNKFKFTNTNSNSQKQIQIHKNKFKFTKTNSNSQKQIQIHKNKFKFTKTNSNTQNQIQIHKYKFKYKFIHTTFEGTKTFVNNHYISLLYCVCL